MKRALPILCAIVVVGCASSPEPKSWPAVEVPSRGTVVEGMASWYGPGFHGKRTASGEVYDMGALTAAHLYWAFGTKVKVTLLETGDSVVVRVNDRFPGHKGRVIDLSRGAADAIGMRVRGVAKVRLEIVG